MPRNQKPIVRIIQLSLRQLLQKSVPIPTETPTCHKLTRKLYQIQFPHRQPLWNPLEELILGRWLDFLLQLLLYVLALFNLLSSPFISFGSFFVQCLSIFRFSFFLLYGGFLLTSGEFLDLLLVVGVVGI